MSCAAGGRGDRGGLGGRGSEPPRKRRSDDEAGCSSLRPPVEEWRKEQARKRGALSRSSGRRAWSNFDRLDRIFLPAIQRIRAAERAWFDAKEAGVAGDEAAAVQVAALKEEYDMAFVLSNSNIEYHLHVKALGNDDDA